MRDEAAVHASGAGGVKQPPKATGAYLGVRDLSHDPKLAESIGHMIAAWGDAEHSLLCVACYVTNTDIEVMGLGYYSLTTFGTKSSFVRGLIDGWPGDGASLTKIIRKLEDAARTRNKWVHGFWAKHSRTNETVVLRFRAPIGDITRRSAIKAADVQGHTAAVQGWTQALLALLPPA